MPIEPDFPKNYQVIGKHKNADGENYHYVLGPGRLSESSENEEATADYVKRGEELVPIESRGRWLQLIGIPVMQMVRV
jgi:hypothetical protein